MLTNEEEPVDRYARLIDRARSGEQITIDGATGSECLRRGGPDHMRSVVAQLRS